MLFNILIDRCMKLLQIPSKRFKADSVAGTEEVNTVLLAIIVIYNTTLLTQTAIITQTMSLVNVSSGGLLNVLVYPKPQ